MPLFSISLQVIHRASSLINWVLTLIGFRTIFREAEEAQKCINDYGSTCPQIVKDYFFKRSVEDGMNNGEGFEDYLRTMNQGYCRIIDEEDSEDGPNCML